MCMYTSSGGKINRSQSKNEFQISMFSMISVRHVGVRRKDTNMVSAC